MTLDDDRLEVLDTSTCRTLLATVHLGRVALSRQALPIIVPVVYKLVGQQILIPAASLLVRSAAQSGDVVCFEADAQDPVGSTWSVLVVGSLSMVSPTRRPPPDDGQTDDSATGDLVGLTTSRISGRRTTMPLDEFPASVADPGTSWT